MKRVLAWTILILCIFSIKGSNLSFRRPNLLKYQGRSNDVNTQSAESKHDAKNIGKNFFAFFPKIQTQPTLEPYNPLKKKSF